MSCRNLCALIELKTLYDYQLTIITIVLIFILSLGLVKQWVLPFKEIWKYETGKQILGEFII